MPTEKRINKKDITELLLNINNDIAQTKNLDEALDTLVNITSSVVGAERATVFINDDSSQELYSRVAQGNFKREIRFMNNKGIAGWVFQNDKGSIVDDAYKDDRFNKSIDMRTGYRTKSILCAPLRTISGEVIGVTQLLNKIKSTFNNQDLDLLESMTKQAAIAIQSHVMIEIKEKEREKELRFQEIVSEVSTEIDLPTFISKMFDVICNLLDCERASLFLNDEKTDELYMEVGTGLDGAKVRFPNHLGIAGHVFTTGEFSNIPHTYADLRFNPGVDKQTGYFTRNLLTTPLRNKEGKILGVCQALNKRGGPFSDDDAKKMMGFTSQISMGINNAQLFANVQQLNNYNESMLTSMSNSVITVDDEGNITTCNSSGMSLLGIGDEESIIKKSFKDIFTGPNQWLSDRIDGLEEAKTYMDQELDLGGEKKSINLSLLPLIDDQEEIIGTLVMIEDISNEKRMKSTMSRYMDADLADQLLEAGQDDVLGGKESLVTVLMSDVRSFTSITEELGAHGTVQLLNDYFTVMVDCIQEEGGMLDKFIGDAMMCIFGTPMIHDDDPDRAMRASIKMMTELLEFNNKRASEGKPPIDHGVGLNTDMVISGNIGSPKRMDYTVIGDGVNLAARTESLCKQYGAKILLTSFTLDSLKATYRTRQVDMVVVKGKTEPVAIFEAVDFHTKDTFPNAIEVLGHFNNGIEYYNEGEWDKAIKMFSEALKGNPEDVCSAMYTDRCKYLKKENPKDWNGVWVMKTK